MENFHSMSLTDWADFFNEKRHRRGVRQVLIVSEQMPQETFSPIPTHTATSAAFLPYPASRLAPKIVPQDLTNFKTRGVGRVERELQQEMVELREKYLAVMDAFNWNKLIFEAHFGFEPVTGEDYHLYEMQGRHVLSMIGPSEWHQRWIGSFRLNADCRWLPVEIAPDFDLRTWIDARVGE